MFDSHLKKNGEMTLMCEVVKVFIFVVIRTIKIQTKIFKKKYQKYLSYNRQIILYGYYGF